MARSPNLRVILVTLAVLLVGAYYVLETRAAGTPFYFGYTLGGYYNYLGRAFASGKLYVPIDPSPQLLAQPNPWDPAVDDSLKMHDMALYNGRYYLYHGAGPAWLLFTPWRLITKWDLPENAALPLFCFGGFLFLCAALREILNQAQVPRNATLAVATVVALGFCQAVPYLLNRVWVYEIAIGGGFFCLSAALYFLARALRPSHPLWLSAAGLMFGLAVACRPHLGLAAAIAFVALLLTRASLRGLAAFAIPLTVVGAIIALYNYARFGSPFEFGIRYLLSGPNQNRIKLTLANVIPGLYHFLLSPPEFSPVFPWIRQIARPWPAPPDYFLEPTAGALTLAPFILAAWLVPSVPRVRAVLWIATLSAAAILLFIAATGFTTQRYTVDFLPLAVFAALANLSIHIDRLAGAKRALLAAALLITIFYSMVANLALGVTGPYDNIVKNHPARYQRLASWFSPVARFRPMLNPKLALSFKVDVSPRAEGLREPLVTIEHPASRHFIYVEHGHDQLRFVSQSAASTLSREIPLDHPKTLAIGVTYAPDTGKLTTCLDGKELLVHDIGPLIAAPAQIVVGENRIDPGVTAPHFTGRIESNRNILN